MATADHQSQVQHYDQSCAVPYRQRQGNLEVCLVTSSRGNWIFPKGVVDLDDSPGETAIKEAREEAGLLGEIVGAPLGTYTIVKNGDSLQVIAFLMKVARCTDEWDESDRRERQWVALNDAYDLVSARELQDLLDVVARRMGRTVA